MRASLTRSFATPQLGMGVQQSDTVALDYIKKAAEQGHPDAMCTQASRLRA
jgi:TPR repeat protein